MPVKYLFYNDTYHVRPYAPPGFELRCVKKDSAWRPSCAYCDSTLSADRHAPASAASARKGSARKGSARKGRPRLRHGD